jgi:enoyl-CoA hydratase/carnithine racemase
MKEQTVTVELQNQVASVNLTRGVTNAINAEVVQALSLALDGQTADPEVRGVVLTSANNKFFSIGLDIPQLITFDESEFRVFYQAFNKLCIQMLTFPKPLVAAIPGHAIAGGCIISLVCDYRFIAEGRTLIGLNEIKLGIQVPFVADCMLRRLIGYRNARDVMNSGGFLEPEEALQLGMVDRIIPVEEVRSQSVEKVRALSADSLQAFALIKSSRVRAVECDIEDHLGDREDAFVQRWFSAEARERLQEAITKY